jgi:hypothetical protein
MPFVIKQSPFKQSALIHEVILSLAIFMNNVPALKFKTSKHKRIQNPTLYLGKQVQICFFQLLQTFLGSMCFTIKIIFKMYHFIG